MDAVELGLCAAQRSHRSALGAAAAGEIAGTARQTTNVINLNSDMLLLFPRERPPEYCRRPYKDS
jgi:hypothetical protein